MATARDIVTRALEHLHVIGAGEAVEAPDADLAMRALRSLLDAMQLEPRSVVGLKELTYTPSAGSQSFTIGPTGNIVAVAPVAIDPASFYRVNGVDVPLRIGTLDEYNAEADKSARGSPSYVALSRSYDTATVYIHPAADGLTQFRLWVEREPLSGFASIAIGDTLTLPAGMQSMLEWALAEEMESDYSVPPDVAVKVRDKAARARKLYKRSNTRIGAMSMPYGVPSAESYEFNTD